MSFREFEAVVAVADELHFGRAAERLGLAQPQLSELVRRLERRSRVTVFVRRPRVELTPAGAVLVDSARRVIAEAASGVERARAIAAGQVGTVALGFSPASMLTELPGVLKAFAKAHPQVTMRLCEGTSNHLWRGLERGDLDLIVSRQPHEDPRARNLEIIDDEIMLVLPDDHPAAARPELSLKEVEAEVFVFFGRAAAPAYYDRIMRSVAAAGVRLDVRHEADSWLATLGLVGSGMGLSLGTRALSRLGFPGIRHRPLTDPMPDASFWLTWLPERLSPAAANLRERLEQTLTA